VEPDWVSFCAADDLDVRPPRIDVVFPGGRRHRVTVRVCREGYRLAAVVVRQDVVAERPDLPILIWKRNRATALVGFRLDPGGRLIGESCVPRVGLSADEFRLHVRRLAGECDRLEYLLTGRDAE